MLRVRLDVACNEGAQRRIPITVKQLDGQDHVIGRRKGRLDDRARRACYLCDEINGQPGVFESESLYHMLMECPHQSMVVCRDLLRQRVIELSMSDEAMLQSPEPPEFDQSKMWAVMMLCASSASFPVQLQMEPLQRPWVQLVVSPAEQAVAEGIRARVATHDRDGIIRAVAWLQPLLDRWMDRLRGYHKVGDTAVMPGAKLAALVTKHMRTVFRKHRAALENNVGYRVRNRDPTA